MLPAETIAEITTNLASLHLETNITAQVLAAVLMPLIRSSESPDSPPSKLAHKRAARRRLRARKAPRRRKYKRHAPAEARDRALTALRANPDATPTEIAKIATVSRSTAVNAHKHLAREARRKSRASKTATVPRGKTDAKTERRERAQRFLRETLANGPKRVSDVEEAAAKAHGLLRRERARRVRPAAVPGAAGRNLPLRLRPPRA